VSNVISRFIVSLAICMTQCDNVILLQLLLESTCSGHVVVLMGSYGDDETAMKIHDVCETYGITCELRVTSAHKGPDSTLKVISEYEGQCELLL